MAHFGSLPHAVQVHIFGLLPLDSRIRCLYVCRTWRFVLRDAVAWKHLTLPDFEFTGVGLVRVFGSAVRHAQGELETLDVSNLIVDDKEFLDYTFFILAQPQLRELRLGATDFRDSDQILHILEKAPQLQLLSVASRWSQFFDRDGNRLALVDELYRDAVRIRTLGLDFQLADMDYDELHALFTVIRRGVGTLTHPEFTALYLDMEILNETSLNFIADLAAAHEPTLCVLGLERFPGWAGVSFDTTVRLLRLNAVPRFDSSFWVQYLERNPDYADSPAIWTEICAAVSGCTSLHTVMLDPRLALLSERAWRQLTAALAGHPSIARIQLDDEEPVDWGQELFPVWFRVRRSVEYGRGIAEIIAANSPALRRLYVCDAALEEDGLGLVVAALPRNTHLKHLSFGTSSIFESDSDDSLPLQTFWRTDFIEDRFIPALRRMPGLRHLYIEEIGTEPWDLSAEYVDEDDIANCDQYELAWIALQAAVVLVRERSDPELLAAARNWQRAYRKWTTPRTQP
jgi:hypothetical protein